SEGPSAESSEARCPARPGNQPFLSLAIHSPKRFGEHACSSKGLPNVARMVNDQNSLDKVS
ncbi:MAG: hypothetical protein JSU96_03025, partial [Acidobacteriota bacterium]